MFDWVLITPVTNLVDEILTATQKVNYKYLLKKYSTNSPPLGKLGFLQKEKVHIDGKKAVQISTAEKKLWLWSPNKLDITYYVPKKKTKKPDTMYGYSDAMT